MVAATVRVTGLPKALHEEAEQGDGPLHDLGGQLATVLGLAIRSHPQVMFDLAYAGHMPAEGYELSLVVTGFEQRLVGSIDAELAAAVLAVVMVRFAGPQVPEYRKIEVYPAGRRRPSGWIRWEHPRTLDPDRLLAAATVVCEWCLAFSEMEALFRTAQDQAEGDAWASVRVWADEIMRDLERFYGSPLPASVYLRGV